MIKYKATTTKYTPTMSVRKFLDMNESIELSIRMLYVQEYSDKYNQFLDEGTDESYFYLTSQYLSFSFNEAVEIMKELYDMRLLDHDED